MSAPAAATPKPKAKAKSQSRLLVVAVLTLTLLAMGLGGAVLVVKLRPDTSPPSPTEQNLQAWEQAVEANPGDAQTQAGFGVALLEAGKTDEARDAFEAAIRLDRTNWLANFQLGLLVREENPDRALLLLKVAEKSATTDNKAMIQLAEGDFLLEKGKLKTARDAYQRSISNLPYVFDSHYGLAQAFEQLGEVKSAIREYKAAGQFAPGDPRIKEALKRLNQEQ
jgi:tetratricopeptide (TPR) repeat protein